MALFKKKEKQEEAAEIEESSPSLPVSPIDPVTGLVKTTLIIHPDWDISNQERYVYMYHHQKLPLLQVNQLSISGLRMVQFDEGFVIIAFLRSSLPKAFRLERITVMVLGENDTPVARKVFELDTVGDIQPYTCMPWRFLFENENKLIDGPIPENGWQIVFELD